MTYGHLSRARVETRERYGTLTTFVGPDKLSFRAFLSAAWINRARESEQNTPPFVGLDPSMTFTLYTIVLFRYLVIYKKRPSAIYFERPFSSLEERS